MFLTWHGAAGQGVARRGAARIRCVVAVAEILKS
jgi:hypothetical protein